MIGLVGLLIFNTSALCKTKHEVYLEVVTVTVWIIWLPVGEHVTA
jgi:hypothetical protein